MYERGQLFGGIGKQDILYESNGTGSAFDIREYGDCHPASSLVLKPIEALGNVIASKVGDPSDRIVE